MQTINASFNGSTNASFNGSAKGSAAGIIQGCAPDIEWNKFFGDDIHTIFDDFGSGTHMTASTMDKSNIYHNWNENEDYETSCSDECVCKCNDLSCRCCEHSAFADGRGCNHNGSYINDELRIKTITCAMNSFLSNTSELSDALSILIDTFDSYDDVYTLIVDITRKSRLLFCKDLFQRYYCRDSNLNYSRTIYLVMAHMVAATDYSELLVRPMFYRDPIKTINKTYKGFPVKMCSKTYTDCCTLHTPEEYTLSKHPNYEHKIGKYLNIRNDYYAMNMEYLYDILEDIPLCDELTINDVMSYMIHILTRHIVYKFGTDWCYTKENNYRPIRITVIHLVRRILCESDFWYTIDTDGKVIPNDHYQDLK